MEASFCRPFGEVVHELRVSLSPALVAGRLSVSRHFLYEHFGWAMDKVAYVEKQYGLPLGLVVARRRAEDVSLAAMAREWGLAVTTLYNAVRRFAGSTMGEPGNTVEHRTMDAEDSY